MCVCVSFLLGWPFLGLSFCLKREPVRAFPSKEIQTGPILRGRAPIENSFLKIGKAEIDSGGELVGNGPIVARL